MARYLATAEKPIQSKEEAAIGISVKAPRDLLTDSDSRSATTLCNLAC
jgi:hypothetical protein